MSKEKEKNLFVVDHANKSGDRERRNPNRAAKRRVAAEWQEHLAKIASGQPTQVNHSCMKKTKTDKDRSREKS
ncbi:MAG: hypothetical protein AAFX56_07035 [Pseudomonadota bacterium]